MAHRAPDRKVRIVLKMVARVLGIIVALLAIVGFFVEGQHLFGFMNVDLTLDIVRVIIAVALLYVGFADVPVRAVRTVVAIVGAMYVVMGLVAFADPEMFGLLPTGFTGFDIAFHLIVGIGSLIVAFLPERAVEGSPRTSRA